MRTTDAEAKGQLTMQEVAPSMHYLLRFNDNTESSPRSPSKQMVI